jgi:hypothetical protein
MDNGRQDGRLGEVRHPAQFLQLAHLAQHVERSAGFVLVHLRDGEPDVDYDVVADGDVGIDIGETHLAPHTAKVDGAHGKAGVVATLNHLAGNAEAHATDRTATGPRVLRGVTPFRVRITPTTVSHITRVPRAARAGIVRGRLRQAAPHGGAFVFLGGHRAAGDAPASASALDALLATEQEIATELASAERESAAVLAQARSDAHGIARDAAALLAADIAALAVRDAAALDTAVRQIEEAGALRVRRYHALDAGEIERLAAIAVADVSGLDAGETP